MGESNDDGHGNSIAPDMHCQMQRQSFRPQEKPGSWLSIFCDARRGRPRAPARFMNILGILMRFPTTILIHEFGAAVVPSSHRRRRCRRRRSRRVRLASLGTLTAHAGRASNSPERSSNIKRNINEWYRNDANTSPPSSIRGRDLFLADKALPRGNDSADNGVPAEGRLATSQTEELRKSRQLIVLEV